MLDRHGIPEGGFGNGGKFLRQWSEVAQDKECTSDLNISDGVNQHGKTDGDNAVQQQKQFGG